MDNESLSKQLEDYISENAQLKGRLTELVRQTKSAALVEGLGNKVFHAVTHPLLVINLVTRTVVWANRHAVDLFKTTGEKILKSSLDELSYDLYTKIAKDIPFIEVGNSKSFDVSEIFNNKHSVENRAIVKVTSIVISDKRVIILELFKTQFWPEIKELLHTRIEAETNAWRTQLREAQEKIMIYEKKLENIQTHHDLLSTGERHVFYSQKVLPNGNLALDYLDGASIKKITGFSHEEINEDGGWSSIIIPSDLSNYLQTRKQVFENKTISVEYRILSKAGKIIHIKDTMAAGFEENGRSMKLIKIVGIFEDVTEFKSGIETSKGLEDKAKQDAAKVIAKVSERTPDRKPTEEKILFSIIDQSFPLQIYHDNCVIIDINQQFASEFGYKKEDLMKRTLYDIVDGDYKTDLLSMTGKKDPKIFRLGFKSRSKETRITDAVQFSREYNGRVITVLALKLIFSSSLFSV